MVLIFKKLVLVFQPSDKVKKQYLNLRKAVYVTTFTYPYPHIPDILIQQYGLKPNDNIFVFWTRELEPPHFARYRIRFKRIYAGKVICFNRYTASCSSTPYLQ